MISLLAVSLFFTAGGSFRNGQIHTGAASELQGWMRGRASIVFVLLYDRDVDISRL
ncbi:hypothetical protein [Saccharococcus caldoxylosilyticus]|uniref:Uncharacterized protein n=1 Tax=Saccharococcus caldoxylosilyticus TaxID=81408 RepID=A0A150LYM8_9BACL|nr:hypothetical protein [Parageobacillus caldoxylosilyticus]KYD17397.1 hypothetical protein B4119_2106 [Parageobacillus caldoxylosilyticus]